MTQSLPKLRLSQSRDIPFDKLVLSQANVRRVKTGISIEELAEDWTCNALVPVTKLIMLPSVRTPVG
jgi:hypothetical protein